MHLKKPSFRRTDFSPGWTHKSDSLPNFGVNNALQTIPVTWSFAVWGLDIVGPLWKAPESYTHLLVAIDKFSKWVEVRPIMNLRAEQAVTFFTDIIYRFGVPNSINTDNGSQFTGRKFLEFCDKFHIHVD
jgi:hypothetical protein